MHVVAPLPFLSKNTSLTIPRIHFACLSLPPSVLHSSTQSLIRLFAPHLLGVSTHPDAMLSPVRCSMCVCGVVPPRRGTPGACREPDFPISSTHPASESERFIPFAKQVHRASGAPKGRRCDLMPGRCARLQFLGEAPLDARTEHVVYRSMIATGLFPCVTIWLRFIILHCTCVRA